ncbi:MAG TPA: hypothetical protein VGO91_15390 [Pyrinomonadaceae bacterium]|nr:hypothetical protein [Pyrinomonadaceae bacterium]
MRRIRVLDQLIVRQLSWPASLPSHLQDNFYKLDQNPKYEILDLSPTSETNERSRAGPFELKKGAHRCYIPLA